jgi:hypothetical protein
MTITTHQRSDKDQTELGEREAPQPRKHPHMLVLETNMALGAMYRICDGNSAREHATGPYVDSSGHKANGSIPNGHCLLGLAAAALK